jgi:hypothetical protein
MRLFAIAFVLAATPVGAATIEIPSGSLTFTSQNSFSGSSEEIFDVLGYPDEIYRSTFNGGFDPSGNIYPLIHQRKQKHRHPTLLP